MPVPVFEQPALKEVKKEEAKPTKEKFSGWAIFFALLLITVLVILGEFAFRDSDRLFNPYYQSCRVESKITFPYFLSEESVAKACDIQKYEQTRLLLHADVAVPLIIISLLGYLFLKNRKFSSQTKLIFYAYLLFALWISTRIIFETEYYLLKHNELIGKYIVLISIAIILGYLIFLIQKKFWKRVEKEIQ